MAHFTCASIGISIGTHIAYEIDESARCFLTTKFPDMFLQGTVVDRPDNELVYSDVFTSGFPCQPFSLLGLQQGWHDTRGRGTLVLESLRYLKTAKPMVAVFENVRAFASSGGELCCVGWLMRSRSLDIQLMSFTLALLSMAFHRHVDESTLFVFLHQHSCSHCMTWPLWSHSNSLLCSSPVLRSTIWPNVCRLHHSVLHVRTCDASTTDFVLLGSHSMMLS